MEAIKTFQTTRHLKIKENNLNKILDIKGLSGAELANLVGSTPISISKIRRNRVRVVNSELVGKIIFALNINFNDFYVWEERTVRRQFPYFKVAALISFTLVILLSFTIISNRISIYDNCSGTAATLELSNNKVLHYYAGAISVKTIKNQ